MAKSKKTEVEVKEVPVVEPVAEEKPKKEKKPKKEAKVEEPKPEVKADVKEEAPAEDSYDKVHASMAEIVVELVAGLKKAKDTLKLMDKAHKKEIRASGKGRRSRVNKEDRKPSGFNRATPVPKEYIELLKLEPGTELKRTAVTKKFYEYVHEHGLQSKMIEKDGVKKLDKRVIIPDAPLRKALNLKEGEELNFKNFQKHLSVRYPKKVVPAVAKVEEAPAPAVEEKKPAKPKKVKKEVEA